MKIDISVDMSPEELRRLMGLPDVQEFNREVMQHMLKKVQNNADEYDPVAFFKSNVMGNTDVLKNWMEAFNRFANAANTGNRNGADKSGQKP